MAIFYMQSPVVLINAVDLSDHIRSLTITTERDELDGTAFGAVNKVTLAGLGDATMEMEAFQDFAAGEVDATLWPLSQTNTPFVVSAKHTTASVGPTNPLYSMTALMFSYSPLDGEMGEMSMVPLNFKNAAQAGLTRATA